MAGQTLHKVALLSAGRLTRWHVAVDEEVAAGQASVAAHALLRMQSLARAAARTALVGTRPLKLLCAVQALATVEGADGRQSNLVAPVDGVVKNLFLRPGQLGDERHVHHELACVERRTGDTRARRGAQGGCVGHRTLHA